MMIKQLLAPRFGYVNDAPPTWSTLGIEELLKLKDKMKGGAYRFQEHSCPICHATDYVVIAERDRYGLPITTAVCRTCGLVQTNPYLRRDDYVDFYKNHFFGLYRRPFKPVQILFKERTWHGQGILHFVRKHSQMPQNALVLDVGCGSGGILHVFKEAGYRTLGIDYGLEVLERGRQLNMDLRVGDIFNVRLDEQPQLIIYSHVLEHIQDLNRELGRVREVLSDDGRLYIEVPGVKDIRNSAFAGDLLKSLHVAHIYHFTLTTLTNLLRKNGFELIAGNERVQAVFRKAASTEHVPTSDFRETMRFVQATETRRKWYRARFKIRGFVAQVRDAAIHWAVRALQSLGLYERVRKWYLNKL